MADTTLTFRGKPDGNPLTCTGGNPPGRQQVSAAEIDHQAAEFYFIFSKKLKGDTKHAPSAKASARLRPSSLLALTNAIVGT